MSALRIFLRRGLLALSLAGPLALLAADAPPAKEPPVYPSLTLSRGDLSALLYLPDAEQGYYRGPRFSWGGMVARLSWGQRTLFAPWTAEHDPLMHDHGIGTAGEFGMMSPLGYDEAAVGESFIKIGVGWLERFEDKPYGFMKAYKVQKPAPWTLTKGADWAELTQELKDPRGWGYLLKQRFELLADAPGLKVSYELRNTGERLIVTEHYSHNFVVLDDEPIGANYLLAADFAFKPKANRGGLHELKGERDLTFAAEWPAGAAFFAPLQGLRGQLSDNRMKLSNRKSGTSLTLSGDWAPVKYHLFATQRAVCPEPILSLDLQPGATRQWTTRYELGATP